MTEEDEIPYGETEMVGSDVPTWLWIGVPAVFYILCWMLFGVAWWLDR